MSVCGGHERGEWGDVLTGSSFRQQPVVSASFDRSKEVNTLAFFLLLFFFFIYLASVWKLSAVYLSTHVTHLWALNLFAAWI